MVFSWPPPPPPVPELGHERMWAKAEAEAAICHWCQNWNLCGVAAVPCNPPKPHTKGPPCTLQYQLLGELTARLLLRSSLTTLKGQEVEVLLYVSFPQPQQRRHTITMPQSTNRTYSTIQIKPTPQSDSRGVISEVQLDLNPFRISINSLNWILS